LAKEKDAAAQVAAARKQIIATPTASDAQVAAAAGVDRHLVAGVRAEMGAKHTWPKPKEEKSK